MPKVHAIETAPGRFIVIPSWFHVDCLHGVLCTTHSFRTTLCDKRFYRCGSGPASGARVDEDNELAAAPLRDQVPWRAPRRRPVIPDCRCAPSGAVLASPHLGKPDAGAGTSTLPRSGKGGMP